jgi:hypothetical protein
LGVFIINHVYVWVYTASYIKACTTFYGIATYVDYQIFHQIYLIQLVLKPQTDLTSLMTLQLVKAVLEALILPIFTVAVVSFWEDFWWLYVFIQPGLIPNNDVLIKTFH